MNQQQAKEVIFETSRYLQTKRPVPNQLVQKLIAIARGDGNVLFTQSVTAKGMLKQIGITYAE